MEYCACRVPLPCSSLRRTLGSSTLAINFLETFGELRGVAANTVAKKSYICKPCLKKLETGHKVIEQLEDLRHLTEKCGDYFGISVGTDHDTTGESSDEGTCTCTCNNYG